MSQVNIQSDVTGAVWEVHKAVGDSVSEGDTILVVESMKMEIPVLTEIAGSVVEVRVKSGDTVDEGATVAVVTQR